jgi:tetratricopeptide (TPR) repeat protein
MNHETKVPMRVRRGFVKFNVRRHALGLGTFTVADIVRVTHLNGKSVRTELQRMQRDGFLFGEPSLEASGQRGGPPTLYRINPKKRSALSHSLDDFSLPQSPGARPTSPHYLSARQLLNRAQQIPSLAEREPLLTAAEQCLAMAAEAEGGDRAPDRVTLCLEYEKARLLCLRGADEEAASRVAVLRGRCAGSRDEAIVRHLEELQLYLLACDRFVAQSASNVDEVAWAHCLLDTLEERGYQPEGPLTALFLSTLSRIAGRSGTERMQRFLYAKVPRLQPMPGRKAANTHPAREPVSRDESALHLRKARAAFQLQRYDDALTSFSRAIDLAPDNTRSIAARGETYRRLERYDDAMADFNRAIELEPEFAWAIAARGHVYRLKGRYSEAMADFDHAIELEPDYAWAIAERGHVHRANARFEEALADFNHAIALDPDDPWLVASRGQVHRAMRNYGEALADFKRAIDLSPENPWLVVSRGQLYATLRRYDEALADFDRAIELNSDLPWPVAERARIYRLLGHREVARIDFKRAQTIQAIEEVRGYLERGLAIIPPDHPEAPTMRALLNRLQSPDASWEALYEAYEATIAA